MRDAGAGEEGAAAIVGVLEGGFGAVEAGGGGVEREGEAGEETTASQGGDDGVYVKMLLRWERIRGGRLVDA